MITEKRVERWQDLSAIADKFLTFHPTDVGHWFRGQSNADWTLAPTLSRLLPTHAPHMGLRLEADALAEFRSQAHHYLAPNTYSATKDLLDWWTLMQHHGAPTRLLDWTRSIFVAAYFAAREDDANDGAIWILDPQRTFELFRKHYPDTLLPESPGAYEEYFQAPNAHPVVNFIGQPVKSDRMIAQQGVFSVSPNVLLDHAAAVSELANAENDASLLMKVVLAKDSKLEVRRHLRAYNITAASLFPGIDGIGRSTFEIVELGRWR